MNEVAENAMVREAGPTPPVSQIVRLLAVIVLYKVKLSESATLRTLQTALSNSLFERAHVRILIYDNTPGGQDPGPMPADVLYKSDIENGGLAKAYNYAIEIARDEGFEWLLTLDQDTSLPPDFISNICHTIEFVRPLSSVAAIVPRISDGERVLSPKVIIKWGIMKCFPNGFIGIPSGEASAVNSAATLRVCALMAIGGYDPRFQLHSSDVVLFRRLYLNGFKIFVAGNIRVQHEMSVFNLKNRSTPRRYEENIRSEEAFYDEYMGWAGHLVLLLRIFQRLCYRLWRTGGSRAYFKITLQSLCRRLFYSRQRRIRTWQQWVVRQRRKA